MTTYGSVCSGIEAATVALHPLGWQAAWYAEIEAFPSAVLAHHYPDVANLGDMTKIAAAVRAHEVGAPDALIGGTPCQAFSVAGLRNSLADERGNLTLRYVELADAIDDVRRRAGKPEAVIWWENVPGVLSTKDNAFGCFLAGLAGEDEPLQPAGKKWSNAGCVYGPKRAIAWRTLDAQYFGLAQRRRRVFVVASARDGFDPAEVLFEWHRVRRDTAPSRQARKDTARGTGGGPDGGSWTEREMESITGEVAPTLNSAFGSKLGLDNQHIDSGAGLFVATTLRATDGGADVDHATGMQLVAHSLRAEGFDASEDGTGRGTPLVPVAYRTSPNCGAWETGERTDALTTGTDPCATVVSVALCGREGGATAELGDEVQTCLRASGGGGDKAHVLAISGRARGDDGRGYTRPEHVGNIAGTIDATKPDRVFVPGMAVRRLTPRECERLQGFPDDYTLVPYRKKDAADGPRYKALGNSMAVPRMRWIGERIHEELEKTP